MKKLNFRSKPNSSHILYQRGGGGGRRRPACLPYTSYHGGDGPPLFSYLFVCTSCAHFVNFCQLEGILQGDSFGRVFSERASAMAARLSLEASDSDNNQLATQEKHRRRAVAGERALTTTQPRRWATTNDKSVLRMMMAATKRVRVARAMVTAMRTAVNEEGKGGTGHGVGDGGGMRRRGRRRRRQEQWQRG